MLLDYTLCSYVEYDADLARRTFSSCEGMHRKEYKRYLALSVLLFHEPYVMVKIIIFLDTNNIYHETNNIARETKYRYEKSRQTSLNRQSSSFQVVLKTGV
jgi:hypothetical protein